MWPFRDKKKRISGLNEENLTLREAIVKPVNYLQYEKNNLLKNIPIASQNLHKYTQDKLNKVILKHYDKIPEFINKIGTEEDIRTLKQTHGKTDPYSLAITYLIYENAFSRIREIDRKINYLPNNLELSTVIGDFNDLSEHELIEKYIEPLIKNSNGFKDVFEGLGYWIEIYNV